MFNLRKLQCSIGAHHIKHGISVIIPKKNRNLSTTPHSFFTSFLQSRNQKSAASSKILQAKGNKVNIYFSVHTNKLGKRWLFYCNIAKSFRSVGVHSSSCWQLAEI